MEPWIGPDQKKMNTGGPWIPGRRNENRVEVEVKYVETFYNDFVLI